MGVFVEEVLRVVVLVLCGWYRVVWVMSRC